MTIQINFDKLIHNKLSFESWFIMYCLYNKNDKSLIDYVNNCRKIPTEMFNLLEQQELITINRQLQKDNIIGYSMLNITNKGKSLFDIIDFDRMFNELKECYPKEVGDKLNKRRLHTDLKRCKVLYKKIINDDLELHNTICKAAKLYHQEKLKTNSEIYMQQLPTWLHQENYNQYLEEARLSNNIEIEGGQSEDI